MPLLSAVRRNFYKDSVALMRVAAQVGAHPGVRQATLVMGTPANKTILEQAGLLAPELAAAGAGDLMLAVDAESAVEAEEARAALLALLDKAGAARLQADEVARPRSLSLASAREPGAALAQVSTAGSYAAAEAMKALRRGLNVFLFSDNVPLAHEQALKALARQKGLLVMGPDCGTALLHGVPIGFANVVRRGAIGAVGASGTGLQAFTCAIHALGEGISHAIGTGSRDVQAEVGGVTMLQAIELLEHDPATRVIAVVSKPPSPPVARAVVERLAAAGKPAVVLFLGTQAKELAMPAGVHSAATLRDAALAAFACTGRVGSPTTPVHDWHASVAALAAQLAPRQRYLRGLYSGGTFCTEAQVIWRELGMRAWSNAPLDGERVLAGGSPSREHTAVDLGSDEFTVGRPHPMIDPAPRIERLAAEAADPTTAVVVLDVVLGYAAHPDPAGVLAPAIAAARETAARAGRSLPVVAFVCGTQEDVQPLSAQRAELEAAGAMVLPDSTTAAQVAGAIASRAAARDVAGATQPA